MQTVHLLIKGKVQGVYYRATAQDVAAALELRGWVKNTADGDVEIKATGSETAINEFIAWCHRGPERAVVRQVQVTLSGLEDFDGFRIIR